MAQKILIMGESGTGKSTSMRNCDPTTTAVVNPVGKPLPFKAKFDMLNNETDARKITRYMKEQAAAGKKLIVVDDFQYILAVPYMNRIKETGWDKYNDFGANYFEIIDVCKDLPDDVVVVYMTHLETLDNGLTTVKLIGKLLREKITIEGLFTVVLRTGVNEGKYYFYTQNSGKDTVKSPLGMFPVYAIENDLAYVVDKVRNYYEIGEFKTDAEMSQADQAAATDLEKPDAKGRRSRTGRSKEEKLTPPTPKEEKPSRKTRAEVQAENEQKIAEHMAAVDEAIDKATGGAEEVPFDEAAAIADTVPKPDLQKPPRRTRKERQAEQEQGAETFICTEDTCFYIPDADNYVKKHAGDESPKGGKVITEDEFNAGLKRIAQENNPNPVDGAMNPPEPHARGQRRRRTR
nr:MAG: AAA domain protein [Bacteriophage sp.]